MNHLINFYKLSHRRPYFIQNENNTRDLWSATRDYKGLYNQPHTFNTTTFTYHYYNTIYHADQYALQEMYTGFHEDKLDVLENNVKADVPLQRIVPAVQGSICMEIAKDVRLIVCAWSDKNVDYVSYIIIYRKFKAMIRTIDK